MVKIPVKHHWYNSNQYDYDAQYNTQYGIFGNSWNDVECIIVNKFLFVHIFFCIFDWKKLTVIGTERSVETANGFIQWWFSFSSSPMNRSVVDVFEGAIRSYVVGNYLKSQKYSVLNSTKCTKKVAVLLLK